MYLGMNQHKLNLVQDPADIGGFLAETLGYAHNPAEHYAQNLSQLERSVFRIIPEIKRPIDPDDEVDDVEEVEYLVNVARACVFGLLIAQDKSVGYCIIRHCMCVIAIEQAIGNLEDWIEWAAEEFKVDLSAMVH